MKIAPLIFASTLFLFSSIINAQALIKKGWPFASIEQNGDVRINGSTKGRFEPNGNIRIDDSIEGRVDYNGNIRKGGVIVGRLESNGEVKSDGILVGKIEDNGDVKVNGAVIGSAVGVKKERAAVIFFFNFFK
jgi:hypothetical protein